MRRTFLIIIIPLLFIAGAFAQELTVKGIYQGKNLYIKNPFRETGVGFCIQKIIVNGGISIDDIHSSSIELDLSYHQIHIGKPVEIVIFHSEDCTPTVVNPEVLKPKSTYVIKTISISGNTLKWSTREEDGSLPFVVEQFKWNKWNKIGEVKGTGIPQTCFYSFNFTPISGVNKFRVKQIDFTKKPRYSKVVSVAVDKTPVKYSPESPKEQIIFTESTCYEIYNAYGMIVLYGCDKVVNVAKLEKGIYYMNYDNTTTQLKKR